MKLEDFLNSQTHEVKQARYPIKKIKEKENEVLLYLENEKLCVSIEDYFKYHLSSLKGLDDYLYDELKKNEKIFLAKKGCLRKLSMKDYSVQQIRDYLRKAECSKQEKENIIQDLISIGLLDDEKYCISRIHYLNETNCSNKQIKLKLKKEGIAEELIAQNLTIDSSLEYDKALHLAEKYKRTIKNKSLNATKQNIVSKLVSNGFSYEISSDIVGKMEFLDNNELELLEKEYTKALKKYSNKYEGYELNSKLYSYLMAKGFKSEDIKKKLNQL